MVDEFLDRRVAISAVSDGAADPSTIQSPCPVTSKKFSRMQSVNSLRRRERDRRKSCRFTRSSSGSRNIACG